MSPIPPLGRIGIAFGAFWPYSSGHALWSSKLAATAAALTLVVKLCDRGNRSRRHKVIPQPSEALCARRVSAHLAIAPRHIGSAVEDSPEEGIVRLVTRPVEQANEMRLVLARLAHLVCKARARYLRDKGEGSVATEKEGLRGEGGNHGKESIRSN